MDGRIFDHMEVIQNQDQININPGEIIDQDSQDSIFRQRLRCGQGRQGRFPHPLCTDWQAAIT